VYYSTVVTWIRSPAGGPLSRRSSVETVVSKESSTVVQYGARWQNRIRIDSGRSSVERELNSIKKSSSMVRAGNTLNLKN
jgi:hypothetical protein